MDVSAVFEEGDLFGAVVEALAEETERLGATTVAGVESRGFLLGGAVANAKCSRRRGTRTTGSENRPST